MNRILGLVAALFALAAAPAFAAPLAYINVPMDTPNSAANAVITEINAGIPSAATTVACTGTTTSTCTGVRMNVSTTGLTTAAGVTATAMVVTDTSVVAASQIMCQVNGYAGTGNPVAVNVVPAAGSFAFAIQNTHASAALNATVVTFCLVYN